MLLPAKTACLVAALITTLLLFYVYLMRGDARVDTASNARIRCIEQPREMVFIKGGQVTIGDDDKYREEAPSYQTTVGDFWIGKTEVTNAQFSEFVEATGYVTLPERVKNPADYPDIPPELLRKGSALFAAPLNSLNSAPELSWWQFVEDAYWREPRGSGSSIEGKENYPVVHIAYEDALAYAEWKGQRLPSEAEFEYAAKAGGAQVDDAWGEGLTTAGEHRANTWQGAFPFIDLAEDGHAGIAPVGCFPPNQYGVYDMIGNVWEWTNSAYFPSHKPKPEMVEEFSEDGFDPNQPGMPVRVVKGGSFLCAPSYCLRYRPAARQAQDTGLGTNHIGFRTAYSDQG